MKTLLFKASNHHVEEAGEAPSIDGDDPDIYTGYFANGEGDQAVFQYDRQARRGTLRMGGAAWSQEFEVVEGEVRVALDRAEALWLKACWLAATA